MLKCANPKCKNKINNNVKTLFKEVYCPECKAIIKRCQE